MAALRLYGVSARLVPCQKVKIKYFDYVHFQTVLLLICNFYICRGKAINIDADDDSSSIGESINNTTGNSDQELEILGT